MANKRINGVDELTAVGWDDMVRVQKKSDDKDYFVKLRNLVPAKSIGFDKMGNANVGASQIQENAVTAFAIANNSISPEKCSNLIPQIHFVNREPENSLGKRGDIAIRTDQSSFYLKGHNGGHDQWWILNISMPKV